MPDIPGIELGADSNDFFEFEALPKKVAVVGSGYIAVELAGILNLLGAEVDACVFFSRAAAEATAAACVRAWPSRPPPARPFAPQVDLFIRSDMPLRTMEPDVVSLLVEDYSGSAQSAVSRYRFSRNFICHRAELLSSPRHLFRF